jgi:hypothetical protein
VDLFLGKQEIEVLAMDSPENTRRMIGRWQSRFRQSLFLIAGVGLMTTGAFLASASAADETKDDDEETEAQQAARKIVESIELTAAVGEKRLELELLKLPVLRYGDIPRANDRGSVWIWQRAGRPQAVMELFRGADSRSWVHVIHSLSADALEGNFGGQAPQWIPAREGVQWNVLKAAPVPAERPVARARQIKDLAQQFTAHEFWDPDNSRFELRLLIQPVHKYSDLDTGLLDGAVFLLCHGTNPEVVLLIEAVKEEGGAKFRYALARLGHAELHVAFGDKEVWRKERIAVTKPDDPYWMMFRRTNP